MRFEINIIMILILILKMIDKLLNASYLPPLKIKIILEDLIVMIEKQGLFLKLVVEAASNFYRIEKDTAMEYSW